VLFFVRVRAIVRGPFLALGDLEKFGHGPALGARLTPHRVLDGVVGRPGERDSSRSIPETCKCAHLRTSAHSGISRLCRPRPTVALGN
jgi:hypothetical protein